MNIRAVQITIFTNNRLDRKGAVAVWSPQVDIEVQGGTHTVKLVAYGPPVAKEEDQAMSTAVAKEVDEARYMIVARMVDEAESALVG